MLHENSNLLLLHFVFSTQDKVTPGALTERMKNIVQEIHLSTYLSVFFHCSTDVKMYSQFPVWLSAVI